MGKVERYPELLVIGNLNMDLILGQSDLHQTARKKIGDSFLLTPGGNGGNQAVASSRFGSSVALAGMIGTDAFGQQLKESMLSRNIDCSLIMTDLGENTGLSLIIVTEGSENQYWDVRGANWHFTEKEISKLEDYIVHCRILIIGLGIPEAAVVKAMRIAGKAGVPVMFEAYQSRRFSDEIFSLMDYLFLDSAEARELVGCEVTNMKSARVAASTLLKRGVKSAVMIHLKAHGLLVASDEGFYTFKAKKDLPMLDASAMDDTFVGVFSSCRVNGMTLSESSEIAYEAACICGHTFGAQMSIPSRKEIMDRLQMEEKPIIDLK